MGSGFTADIENKEIFVRKEETISRGIGNDNNDFCLSEKSVLGSLEKPF